MNDLINKPTILECTLRDGSYELDFQVTSDDTKKICSSLDEAGFSLIEVGHGVGLGASREKIGIAAETDEDYMVAAANSVKRGSWGMFAIPGIARLDDLERAISYGIGFIRIGISIDKLDEAIPYIKLTKKAGVKVCVNFMKSYVATPSQLARLAKPVCEEGADIVYVVDSAGGMLPKEVSEYVLAIKEVCRASEVGFHGHDNLGLGIANSLAAIEAGATVVDSSLQGLGRSAGNTKTEQLIGCLARMGLNGKIDPIKVMDIGEEHVLPLMKKVGSSSLDTVCGMSLFHSSYLPLIKEISLEYRIDPRLLIVAVCNESKETASKEMVTKHARKISEMPRGKSWKPHYKNYFIDEHSKL